MINFDIGILPARHSLSLLDAAFIMRKRVTPQPGSVDCWQALAGGYLIGNLNFVIGISRLGGLLPHSPPSKIDRALSARQG